MASEQKEDVEKIFGRMEEYRNLDYVSCRHKSRPIIWEIIISEQHWYQLIQLLIGESVSDSLENRFESGVHILILLQNIYKG